MHTLHSLCVYDVDVCVCVIDLSCDVADCRVVFLLSPLLVASLHCEVRNRDQLHRRREQTINQTRDANRTMTTYGCVLVYVCALLL